MIGDIPAHQLIPATPFTNISLDLLGPYTIRGMVNKRSAMKIWGLIIVCQNTRAVKLMPVAGYNTANFLLAFNKFIADHGTPARVVSDLGTQLEKTSKQLKMKVVSSPTDINWDEIKGTVAKSGIEWTLVQPGCQWRNGIAERQVATLKQSLSHVIATRQDINWVEIETFMAQAANITTQRPLGARSFSETTDISHHRFTPRP